MDKSANNQKFKFYGASWCGDCKRIEFLLSQNGITKADYEYFDIDKDTVAAEYVESVNPNGYRSIPVLVFEDDTFMIEPSNEEVIKKINSGK